MKEITSNFFCGTDDFISYTPTTIDYVIIAVSAAFVVLALVMSAKYLIKPGEKNTNHIKYRLINHNKE